MGALFAVEFSWRSANPLVRNGAAWDKCEPVVMRPTVNKIILPLYGFEVRREARSSWIAQIHIFSQKTLNYWGHPPSWMSITGVRSEMNVYKQESPDGFELAFMTTGTWGSIEGGRGIDVVMYIHPDLAVEICYSKDLTEPEPEEYYATQLAKLTKNKARDDNNSHNPDDEEAGSGPVTGRHKWSLDCPNWELIPWHYDYDKTARGCNPPRKAH